MNTTSVSLAPTCQEEPSVWQKVKWFLRDKFAKKTESNTMWHAKREFKALGYIPLDEPQEDGPNKWIQESVLALIKVFSDQGHSGFSAPYCIEMFSMLAKHEPLTPLRGTDDEWNDVSEYGSDDGLKVWQNNRCSHVFKHEYKDGTVKAHDIDAVYYREPSGATFTKGGSRNFIEFPYTPKRVCIDVDADDVPIHKFQIGKYYRHTDGSMISVLGEMETTMYGKTLIAEERHNPNLLPIGKDADAAVNWVEVTKEEWMANFS